MFVSINHGVSWTEADSGLTNKHVRAFAAAGRTLFAGTAGGVFRTGDSSAGWAAVNTGLVDTGVLALAVVKGKVFAGTPSGIYMSADSGLRWNPRDSGLNNVDIRCLASAGDSVIFAGAFGGGVVASVDTFGFWVAVNTGLKNLNVQSLSATSSTLFAGTQNGAVWVQSLAGLVIPGRVAWKPLTLARRFEVAVRSGGVLEYVLPENVRVSVRIFDFRGRLVRDVVNEWQSAGRYVAPLAVRGLVAAGNYVLDFNAGSYRADRRFVVVR